MPYRNLKVGKRYEEFSIEDFDLGSKIGVDRMSFVVNIFMILRCVMGNVAFIPIPHGNARRFVARIHFNIL